jgi:hypothetical protein
VIVPMGILWRSSEVDIKLPVLCATRGSEYLYQVALVVLVGLA